MQEEKNNPIEYILNSPLSGVLSKGFAELYKKKPDFPVSYLANWLKEYSRNKQSEKQNSQLVQKQSEAYKQLCEADAVRKASIQKEANQKLSENEKQDVYFNQEIKKTIHLEDLFRNWFPEYIQKRYNLTGSYVGHLTHPHKALEIHNFESGSQLDTQSPKIIQYIGTSASQKDIMFMKILPNQAGISYEVFNQPEPQPEAQEEEEGNKKQKVPRKTYIYASDVTKDKKIYYFRFPRLGSYACFPLKLKSYLSQNSFEQGVEIYKQHVRQKQETEKEYREKLHEVRQEADQAQKKFEEYEAPEEPNADSENQKNALKQQADRTAQALHQLQENPPKIPDPSFITVEKCYLLGIDTLGKDQTISQETLNKIEDHVKKFKAQFEAKERGMLLDDILAYIQDEPKLQSMQNTYKDIQKNALSGAQEIAKQKTTKQKELEFETSVAKCKKMESIFEDNLFEKSMKTYLEYNIPKYKHILQIGLMLVGFSKQQINLPRSNEINFRKIVKEQYINKLLQKLSDYNLRPIETPQCNAQYKINKILQRLQKIDLEQVIKYNAFIWALAIHLKNMCWCRLQCRDSHIQAYQLSVKAKEQRDAQIQKYKQEMDKALQVHKAELAENQNNNIEQFKQQDWRANYQKQNNEPQQLQIIEKKEFLDLE